MLENGANSFPWWLEIGVRNILALLAFPTRQHRRCEQGEDRIPILCQMELKRQLELNNQEVKSGSDQILTGVGSLTSARASKNKLTSSGWNPTTA